MLDGPQGSELKPLKASHQQPDKPVFPRAVSLITVLAGWKPDAERWLLSVFKHCKADFEVIVADISGDVAIAGWLGSRAAERFRFARIEPAAGYAVAVNVAIDMSVAPVCVLFDTSVELTGDAVTPLLEALSDPSVVLAGPFGLRARAGMKEFEESPGPIVDAVEGYCMAFRREEADDAGPMDPKYRFYRIADIDFSFRLREHGGKAIVLAGLPLLKHEHRMWENTPASERDRLSKRNFYRFLDRWRMREDLLVRD